MKKMLRLLLFSAALAVMLSVGAFAAGEKGIYDPASEDAEKFTITASGTMQKIEIGGEQKDVYLDAESVSVTYQGAVAAKQYLLLVTDQELTGGVVPNANNIQYINQDSPATAGSVTFSTVYPKSLTSGKTYYVYLSSNDEALTPLTLAGTFQYYAARKMGDVDGDNGLSAVDALYTLQASVGNRNLDELSRWAADVDKDGGLSAVDALYVLQASVGNRNLE